MSNDPFTDLKRKQRESWTTFTPAATFTTPVAAHRVRFAGIRPGESAQLLSVVFRPSAKTSSKR
jgi:hypothetical protein